MPSLTLHAPESTTYRIQVRGHLDRVWLQQLSWVTAEEADDAHGETITTLIGALPDQSALAGVLSVLFDLGLTLLAVEIVDATAPAQPQH